MIKNFDGYECDNQISIFDMFPESDKQNNAYERLKMEDKGGKEKAPHEIAQE